METAFVRGSVMDVARREDVSLALAWLNVDLLVIVDRSSSMKEEALPGRSRYERAQAALRDLQERHPGRIAVIAFNECAELCADGRIPPPRGATSLAPALRMARQVYAPPMRVLIVTDGEVHDEAAALAEAATFPVRLEGLYVGPEGGDGAAMLRRICAANGGRANVGTPDRLLPNAQRLLLGE